MIIDVGIPAHALLSATHTDTLAAAVSRGALLYGNATPAWALLAKPSVLSVLSHDGTDVSWVTATGTGAPVRAAGAILTTPTLGVATATSLNGNTFTTGTYTLTGAAGKTLTFNQSVTLIGTDAQTYTFPTTSATIARTDAANMFTGVQTMTSPAITGPVTLTGVAGSSALTLAGGTQTTSFPVLTLTQTWNAGAVIFDGLVFNVTNTASDANSNFLKFQVGGTTLLYIDRLGYVHGTGFSTVGDAMNLGTSGVKMSKDVSVSFSSTVNWYDTNDVFLARGGGAGRLNLTATTNGVGLDVATDAVLKVRTRAHTGDASVSALLFQTMTAIVAAGGGAAPTFTTIGGSGPATAAQNGWLKMTDSGGAACYVPVWK